jgi:hypothetical protein
MAKSPEELREEADSTRTDAAADADAAETKAGKLEDAADLAEQAENAEREANTEE